MPATRQAQHVEVLSGLAMAPEDARHTLEAVSFVALGATVLAYWATAAFSLDSKFQSLVSLTCRHAVGIAR